jgi:hypothetical protein
MNDKIKNDPLRATISAWSDHGKTPQPRKGSAGDHLDMNNSMQPMSVRVNV